MYGVSHYDTSQEYSCEKKYVFFMFLVLMKHKYIIRKSVFSHNVFVKQEKMNYTKVIILKNVIMNQKIFVSLSVLIV